MAAVSHQSPASDWVIRTAIAMLWALLGSVIALPPEVRRADLATFGGRLRLLVAGGVVLPIVFVVSRHIADLHEGRSIELLSLKDMLHARHGGLLSGAVCG